MSANPQTPCLSASKPSSAQLVGNFVLFQVAWFACVLGAAHGRAWIGLVAVTLVCAWHLKVAVLRTLEMRLLLAALMIGVVWESALVATGLLVYPYGTLLAGLAPPWIVAMWPLFATTLNVSLRWLKSGTLRSGRGRWPLAAALGGIAGPLSFIAGERLGAVRFSDAVITTTVLAAGWAVLMPLMIWLADRYDGVVMKQQE